MEIQDISQRKNDLAVKLSDLDSLKYVIDELEKKITSLKADFDHQSNIANESQNAFKALVIQSRHRLVGTFGEVESKIQGHQTVNKEMSADSLDYGNTTIRIQEQSHNTTVSSIKNGESEENIGASADAVNS